MGIKHVFVFFCLFFFCFFFFCFFFLYSNIRQVPRKVLKTKAEGRGFQHLPRDLANVNVLEKKNMFDRYYCIKTENICYNTLFLALFCFAFSLMPRGRNFHGLCSLSCRGHTHLVTAANLWPRYEHIESCVVVH